MSEDETAHAELRRRIDLTAFLEARIDEDERYLKSNRHHLWTERPLREAAAKRAIIAEHGPANGGRDADRCRVCTAIAHTGMGQTDARRFRAPCPTLRLLAAVYSDHPDYRQEWRP